MTHEPPAAHVAEGSPVTVTKPRRNAAADLDGSSAWRHRYWWLSENGHGGETKRRGHEVRHCISLQFQRSTSGHGK